MSSAPKLPPLDDLIQDGMGQLTRVFGTRPVPPAAGMLADTGPRDHDPEE